MNARDDCEVNLPRRRSLQAQLDQHVLCSVGALRLARHDCAIRPERGLLQSDSCFAPFAPGYPYLNNIFGDAEYDEKLASFNSGVDLGESTQLYAFGNWGEKYAGSYENYRLPNRVSYTNVPNYGACRRGRTNASSFCGCLLSE